MHPHADPELEVFAFRHPESIANETDSNFGNTTQSSPKGELQAEHLFRELVNRGTELIVCSTATRTYGPVYELARQHGIECIGTEIFLEWRRPKCTIGKPNSDPEVEQILKNRILQFGPDYEPVDGEETWNETRIIIDSGLEVLRNIAKQMAIKKLGLVGHGLRMRMIFARVLLAWMDEDMYPHLFRCLYDHAGLANCAIMHLWYGSHFRSTRRGWNVELGDVSYLPPELR